jgi:hypothetical protein
VFIPGVRKEKPGNFYEDIVFMTSIRTCLTGSTNGVALYLFAPRVPKLIMMDQSISLFAVGGICLLET